MKGVKKFALTTLLGGLVVVMPAVILTMVFLWLFNLIMDLVQPLADLVSLGTNITGILASIIAISLILSGCFLVGLFVKTRIGKFLHEFVEREVFTRIPGYRVLREIIQHFVGESDLPFSSVVLINPFGTGSWMTGFVTDNSGRDYVTVFVPTGPNPTSGNIYHVNRSEVVNVEASVEDGMQTVIGCGVGSSRFFPKSGLHN